MPPLSSEKGRCMMKGRATYFRSIGFRRIGWLTKILLSDLWSRGQTEMHGLNCEFVAPQVKKLGCFFPVKDMSCFIQVFCGQFPVNGPEPINIENSSIQNTRLISFISIV